MRTVIFLLCWLALGLAHVPAQSANEAGDLYFDGYQAWKAGEKLEQEGNKQGALQKYLDAQRAISSVAQTYPAWQPEVVSYRLRNVEQALARIGYSGAAAPASPPAFTSTPVSPGVAPLPSAPVAPNMTPLPTAPATTGMTNPLDLINQQFQALQMQNADMASKLKLYQDGYTNALKERQKAEGDRDLLVQQMQALNTKLGAMTKDTSAKDAATQAEIQKLRNESKMVADLLSTRTKQFEDSGKLIENLQKEKETLLATNKRLEDDLAKAKRDAAVSPAEMTKLQAENTRLKQELEVARQQVETLKTEGGKKDTEIASLKMQVAGIQAEIAKLRQENTGYQTQVAELTMRLKEMNRGLGAPSPGDPAGSQLAQENEALRAIIMRHLRQQERMRQSKELVIAEMKKMEGYSQALMENLEDMTAGKVRITVDEESLFTEPELKEILASNGGVSATLEAEAGSSRVNPTAPKPLTPLAAPLGNQATTEEKLMVQADAALRSQDYKAASQAFQDVLRANPKNTSALISLAGIRLNEKRQSEAEVLLQKCLVYEPENSGAHYRLGVCYYQQGKMPDALNSFERCLRRDKANARAHHYLGIIANRMSNRARAEAEFKSALAIDPGYGDAHFNLAVLYATGNPPDMGKAREHYRNALQRGIEADPALDRLINPTGATPPTVKLNESAQAR